MSRTPTRTSRTFPSCKTSPAPSSLHLSQPKPHSAKTIPVIPKKKTGEATTASPVCSVGYGIEPPRLDPLTVNRAAGSQPWRRPRRRSGRRPTRSRYTDDWNCSVPPNLPAHQDLHVETARTKLCRRLQTTTKKGQGRPPLASPVLVAIQDEPLEARPRNCQSSGRSVAA